MSAMDEVKLAVLLSKRSKISLTGALDDACASRFGGLWLTNNLSMEVVLKEEVPRYEVVLYLPRRKVKTYSLRDVDMSWIRDLVYRAFKLAVRGQWIESIKINTYAYNLVFKYDLKPIHSAMRAGALIAGVSGKGPSVFALSDGGTRNIRRAWRAEGYENLLVTRIRELKRDELG